MITREETKELLPIMKAFAEGKQIQDKIEGLTDWVDIEEINLEFVGQKILHRIKPEHRPFKNQEECLNEMLKHQPFGWFRSTCNKNLFNTICIDNDGIKITNNLMKSMHSYSNAFSSIKFVDGSPFGIKE